MSNVKFLGSTDEVSTCDCCGKTGLKSTVAVSVDDAEAVYFGVTCAARALKMGVKEVKAATKEVDAAKSAAEKAKRDAEHKAFMLVWDAWLEHRSEIRGDHNDKRFDRIQALGGMKAARELFNADRV